MVMENQELLNEATEVYGSDVVSQVVFLVNTMGDVDALWAQFEDMGMFEYAECIEMLFFDQPE